MTHGPNLAMPVLINLVLLGGTATLVLLNVLSTAAFMLQWQS